MIKLYTQQEFESAKSRDKLQLQCYYCNNSFTKEKHFIQIDIKRKGGKFCTRKCQGLFDSQKNSTNKQCHYCNKSIKILNKELKEFNFCSRSCSAKFFSMGRKKFHYLSCSICGKQSLKKITELTFKCNTCIKNELKQANLKLCKFCENKFTESIFCSIQCSNRYKNLHNKGFRSKGEKMLCEAISNNFPELILIPNDRKVLNGLELDIYLPDLKLAIEWNGAFHFAPIRGFEILQKTIEKDALKIKLCEQLGIQLLVIADPKSHYNKYKSMIDEAILIIKKVIEIGTAKETSTLTNSLETNHA